MTPKKVSWHWRAAVPSRGSNCKNAFFRQKTTFFQNVHFYAKIISDPIYCTFTQHLMSQCHVRRAAPRSPLTRCTTTAGWRLQAMAQLEQRTADIQTPYLLILGAEDKICNVEVSKVIILWILFSRCLPIQQFWIEWELNSWCWWWIILFHFFITFTINWNESVNINT